jgi:hypothetical protein
MEQAGNLREACMEFKIDHSLTYVAIDEPSLYDVYRSTRTLIPSDSDISPRECESYICSSRANNTLKVYVAFWEKSSKTSHVFVPDKQPASQTEYLKTIDEAKNFLTFQGYELEPVKLDYSTAMRQVICSTVKALKAPPKDLKPRHSHAKKEPVEPTPERKDNPSKESSSSPVVLAVAAASPAKTASSPPDASVIATDTSTQVNLKQSGQKPKMPLPVPQASPKVAESLEIVSEVENLRNELQESSRELASVRDILQQAQDEIDSLKMKHAEAIMAKDNEKRTLAEELSILQLELTDTRKSAEENRVSSNKETVLLEENRRVAEELLREQDEVMKLRESTEALEAKLAESMEELSKERAELEILRQLLEESDHLLEAAKVEHARNLDEKASELATALSELTSLQEQTVILQEALLDERDEALRIKSEMAEILEADNKLLQDAKDEAARLMQDKVDIERVAAAALNSARSERKQLVSQIRELEDENRHLKDEMDSHILSVQSKLEDAQTQVSFLRRELLVSDEVSSRELAGLRAEMRRLVEERTEIRQEYVMLESFTIDQPAMQEAESRPVSVHSTSPVVIDEEPCSPTATVEPPVPVGAGKEKPAQDIPPGHPFYVDCYEQESIEFTPDRSLTGIPCPSSDAIVGLYESCNKVEAAPAGYKIQKSGSCICVVDQNGSQEIYLAWQMLESNQVLVFTPTQQPRDQETFQEALQNALFYFESVGFMMSPTDLSAPQVRNRALSRLPILEGNVPLAI